MIQKLKEKEKAIKLRKKGFSYSEILKEVSVAKSTLSFWLRTVGLSKKQRHKLTKRKLAAALRGGKARRAYRIIITKQIKDKARGEVTRLSKRDLWLIGIALYWAEGQKEKKRSCPVRFGNSDPKMIKIFLKWLRKICKVERKDVFFRIYLHETSKNKLEEVKKYWARVTGFSEEYFQNITWKKNKIRTNRKNTGKNYYGLLDIGVKKSTNLNRKIAGWIEGIS